MTIGKALVVLTISIGLSWAQGQLAEGLRKGVVEEEANRNLNAAIQNYRSVMAQFDGERKTAATALFHLANIYARQGRKAQAIAAYARVAQEFSDQTDLAGRSAAQLAALTSPDNSPQAEARRTYRELLQIQIEYAEKECKAQETKYTLGQVQQIDILDARMRLLELQGELALFEAGLAQPKATPGRKR